MDEKTAELRELFMDVTDEETVTERQAEPRGTLTDDSRSVNERLLDVIADIDEACTVTTPLSDEQQCRLVRMFYAGKDDETIATELDVTTEDVFLTRMEFHLIRDADTPSEETEVVIRDLLADGASQATIANETSLSETTVERACEAIDAENRSRRFSYRFRTAFEEILTDADLNVQFTTDTHEDGLEDATDGAETNVEL